MSGFLRSDRAPLAAPLAATIFEGRVARTHSKGDGLVYATGPEYRDAEELSNIVSQLPQVKIYLGHPAKFPASESGQKEVGFIESARVDEDTAVARMVITDQEALDAIKSDTKELSLGYTAKLVGGYQKGIKIDHLAIVDRARCGPVCVLRKDEYMTDLSDAIKKALDEMGMENLKKALDDYMTAMSMCPDCGMTGGDHKDTCLKKTDAVLNTKARNALETEEFAVPGSRKLPIHDEAHVRAAMSRFSQTDFASESEKRTAFHKIMAKAHHFGIDTTGFAKAHGDRADSCTCNSRATSYTTGEHMADTELKTEMDALKAKLEEAHKALDKLEVEATNARKDAEAYKAKVDGLEADAKKAKEDAEALVAKAKADAADALATEVQTRVDARVALIVEAKPYLADADLSKMSDRDIKVAVIKHVDGDDVSPEKSMDYVTGVYEGALKRATAAGASRDTVRTTINEMRKDTAPLTGIDAERAAKANMARESSSAWTK